MAEDKVKKEANKRWLEFWPLLQKAALDSEEHFDKKIFAVSTGALGFMLTLIQFIKWPEYKWIAGVAAGAFVLALLTNMIVHLYAKGRQDKQSDLIDEYINGDEKDDSAIHERIKKDNKHILAMNITSLVCVIIGVAALSTFAILNI